ncbi:hypothetical protein QFZ51_000385 [Chitinophaga sp. W3I9]
MLTGFFYWGNAQHYYNELIINKLAKANKGLSELKEFPGK